MQIAVSPITPTARLNISLGYNTIKTTAITWECLSGREVHTIHLPYLLKPVEARLRATRKWGRGKVIVKHLINYQKVHEYVFA